MKRYFAILMIMVLVGACVTTDDAKRRVHRKAKPKAKTTATVTVTGRAQGHDYVDLGLPSGTMWATMNVGANSPEDYGDYFAWGETAPKSVYDWSTYKWCKGSENTMTKYCYDSSSGYNGFVDNKTELDLADDAAYVNWGSGWCMPSLDQIDELNDICTSEWTTINGVDGQLLTSKINGASLFLPSAGYRWGPECDDPDVICCDPDPVGCWSRTLGTVTESVCAFCLDIPSSFSNIDTRYSGHNVRAVRVSKN